MEFFIKKGSTYPQLVLELIKTNFTDSEHFFEYLANAEVKFSMRDIDTGIYKLINAEAECIPDVGNDGEYLLVYPFKMKDVNKKGSFIGEFNIIYNEGGNLIIPIKEQLTIHVI